MKAALLFPLLCGAALAVQPRCEATPATTMLDFEMCSADYYARAYGVPIEFVKAVIHVESAWHPYVVSSEGCGRAHATHGADSVHLRRNQPVPGRRKHSRRGCVFGIFLAGNLKANCDLSQPPTMPASSGIKRRGLTARIRTYIHRAGRLDDLRLINPARPELSSLYNPFYAEDDDYMAQVNMVFGSFNLHDEFFSKHQLNYLADIVRILHYTGVRFNFYDVIVAVLDQGVLQEQIDKARRHIRTDTSISMQRRLNFEMSVRNLMQSFEDRDRVPKIQGLLNECMTFLDDALSIITGPYDDLLSIDDVIEQELILFVTLNVNKNTEPVRALGKMLLQNIQLVVGKRYESEEERKRANRPLFSVVMDEFAPFGYQNFSQILNTARGTNTAFLFSMQSLPQLLKVGKGFKEDVTSAPNTKIALRTQDEETARYFIRASAEHAVTRRTQSLIRQQLFGFERFQKGMSATEREEREYRAEDEKIKNLPKGQMQILMTDDSKGTLHQHLHVRTPPDITLPGFDWEVLPRLRHSRTEQQGANLRFKTPELVNSALARRIHGVGRR